MRASEAGKLDAWIDFNQDGDWDEDGEQIVVSQSVVAGVNLLGFTEVDESKVIDVSRGAGQG